MTKLHSGKSSLWKIGYWLSRGFWSPFFTFYTKDYPDGVNVFDLDDVKEKSASELLR